VRNVEWNIKLGLAIPLFRTEDAEDAEVRGREELYGRGGFIGLCDSYQISRWTRPYRIGNHTIL